MDTSLEIEHKVLSHLIKTDDYKPRPFVLRMSLVGECPRLIASKATYGRVQEGPFSLDAKQIHRMERGKWCHNMWQSLLKDVYGDDFCCVEEELRLTLPCGYEMVGHNDGLFASINAIYELKTVADHTFDLVVNQDGPLPQHYEQAMFYAGVKGAANILIHYYNTAGGDSRFFLIPFNQEVFNSLVTKMNDIAIDIMNKSNGTIRIPARPYHDPTASPCWYCPLVSQCYENWKAEVKDMSTLYTVDLEDGDRTRVESLIELCASQREARLEATRTEEEAKASIAHEAFSRQKNKVVTDSLTAEIKLGTKGNPLVSIKESK